VLRCKEKEGDSMAKYIDRFGYAKGGEKLYYPAEKVDEFLDEFIPRYNQMQDITKGLKEECEKLRKELLQAKIVKEKPCITKEDALRGSMVKKLDKEKRKEVYERYKKGESVRSLSKAYEISRGTVLNYIKEFEQQEKVMQVDRENVEKRENESETYSKTERRGMVEQNGRDEQEEKKVKMSNAFDGFFD
jgi:cell division septum initiation protein DivIVA